MKCSAMSRRKQAKPRSLKRDEEWDEAEDEDEDDEDETAGGNVVDGDMVVIKAEEEDEEEEEELQRAFSRHSEDYLQDGRPSSTHCPDLENQNSLDSEALGTGSSSWHSEDGRPISRKGGEETPSSCATPTSASFPSEPEVETDVGANADGNNHPAAPYPCQFCDRTFPRLSYLKKHEQSHGDQMPYRCSWCARLFKHKRSRDRHVKLHTGDRRYRCSHCEAAFSRSDHLKIHMKTHDTQKPYQCTACSRGYNTAAALTSHMQSHKKLQSNSVSQAGKLHEVDLGRRSASSYSTSSPPVANSPSPSLHTNCPSGAKNPTKCSSSGGMPNAPSILNSPLKLTCMYCTRDSFTNMQQLQLHVRSMHQAILNGESLVASPSQRGGIMEPSANRDMFLHSADRQSTAAREYGKKYSTDEERSQDDKDSLEVGLLCCNQCTMKFSSLASLRDHLVSIHHRSETFGSALMMCPLCGMPCSSAASYAEHYVLQHCEEKRHCLSGDNTAYEAKDSRLMEHVSKLVESEPADLTNKRSRSHESPYSAGTLLCGQCGAALKDFDSFREHLARHLQADQRNGNLLQTSRRSQCPKCDASFQEREKMLAHLTKHFLGQVTKEYACSTCNKYYPHADLLQRHLLDSHAHHLYRCALCRDTFDSRVAIQVHFAVKHSQECRVYRCNACDATSDSADNSRSTDIPSGESRNFFRSEAEVASHVRNVHAPPPSVLDENPMSRSPTSVTPSLSSTGLRCVFCGFCCSSDLELQLHLANHSSSLYRCPICREGFAVEFLLDRHITQAHHVNNHTSNLHNGSQENGRIHHRSLRSHQDSLNVVEVRSQKRRRSPATSNNNSLNQRDNNKRPNYGNSTTHCELCERGEFANEVELQAHKKLVHASAKAQSKSLTALSMTCAYCGEVCRSRAELESHTRIQHANNEHSESGGGRHKCNICDEVCPSSTTLAEHKLQKHCKIQLSDVCVVCRGTLSSESQFLEHVQGHSLENIDSQQRMDGGTLPHLPAPCVVCRQTLISDLECRMHARHHLRTNSSSQSSTSSPSPGQKTQNNPENRNCCFCLRDFGEEDFVTLPSNCTVASGQNLKVCKPCYIRHSQGLPIFNTPYEHISTGKSEHPWVWTKDNQWESSNDRWDADRTFKVEDRGDGNDGEISTASETNGRCRECGVKFEDVEDAKNHRMEHENAAKTYTCIQCQRSFPTEAKIQQHVRKEHLDSSAKGPVDALRCHLCLFDANSPLQLQGHLIEHTFAGCAALSCYICQTLFTAPIGLQNHMLQEHGLGARPYDCNHCGLKFFFRTELDHHSVTFHQSGENTAIDNHNTKMPDASKTIETHNEEQLGGRTTAIKEESAKHNEDEEINVIEQNDSNDNSQEQDSKKVDSKSEMEIETHIQAQSCEA